VKKVLIVEESEKLFHSLSTVLRKEGLDSDHAYDGNTALKCFEQNPYDVILLDINIPGMNGLDFCKAIRKVNHHIPVIVITNFGDIDTKMEAYSIGVDDYITKPFFVPELLAKIKVFIKRIEQPVSPLPLHQTKDIMLDPNRKIAIREGHAIQLMPKEYNLLEYMVKNVNRIISKNEFVKNLWAEHNSITPETIEVYINLLRNKIDKGYEKKLIFTKPGFGYYINDSPN